MDGVARHLLILGKVQGVFYRNWTVGTANGLDLTGWVRNRKDGSVEAHVEGPVAARPSCHLAGPGRPTANI